MMSERKGLGLWIVFVALIAVATPACAPKRVLQPTLVPGPQPVANRQPAVPPPGNSPAADQAAAVRILEADDDEDYGPAGPPPPDDLSELEEFAADSADLPEDEASPGDLVARLARTQVGKPYGWGADGPERFDCSGLALYVYRQLGIALPRVSVDQASAGVHVERDELQPGDLVFFSVRRAFDHVGIFLGNNRFVHAPRRTEKVRVDTLNDAWWNRAYRGARRVFGGEP